MMCVSVKRETHRDRERPRRKANVAERQQVLTLGGQFKGDHYPTISAFVSA